MIAPLGDSAAVRPFDAERACGHPGPIVAAFPSAIPIRALNALEPLEVEPLPMRTARPLINPNLTPDT